MDFEVKFEGLDDVLKQFDPDVIVKSAKKALQRAAASGKTAISSKIREKFNIKKADLDKKIGVNLSQLNEGVAVLSVRGEPISMTYFSPQQVRGVIKKSMDKTRGIKQTVRARAAASSTSAKIIKNKTTPLPGAFIAKGRGGNVQVFRRKGKERLPIRSLKVVSYPSILKQPENLKAVEDRIAEQLKKELLAALDFYQGKK